MIILRKSYITLIEVLIALGLTMLLLSTLAFFYNQMSYANTRMDVVQEKTFKKLFLHTRFSNVFPTLTGETGKKDKKEMRSDFQFFTSSGQSGLFKSNTQSLVFSYNNGVDLDKKLSNHVLGRLYVDATGRLILATWPSPVRWPSQGEVVPPMTKQVLLDHVDNLSFEFYIAPDRNRDFLKNSGKQNDNETSPQDAQQQNSPGGAPNLNANTKINLPSPTVPDQNPSPPQNPPENATATPAGQEDKGEEPQPKGSWVKEWRKEYKQLPSMIRITVGLQDASGHRQSLVFSYPLANSKKVIVYEN